MANINNRNKKISNWTYLKRIFTNKQVMISLLATMILLLLFRIGASLTLPGVKLNGVSSDTEQSFLGILNILGGGGITRFSFMAIGVSPYITAQIIIQLLSSDLIKPLTRLTKAGEKGKRKIEIINRILTIPFAIMQAYAVLSLAANSGAITIFGQTSVAAVPGGQLFLLLIGMTAGTFLTIFLADVISKRGIGNGITLIILSGILSSLFSNFSNVFEVLVNQSTSTYELLKYFSFILYLVFFILILLAVVFMNGSTRKIPIQQIGQGLTTESEEMPYLPIKLNAAGVIPVIFASSLMTIPPTIAQFLSPTNGFVTFVNEFLAIETPVGLTIYAILIFLFGFFYSHIQVNPEKLAENLKKSGKYIPGVKVGEETYKYITRTLNRVNWLGVPFLVVIAIIPYIISMTTNIPNGLAIGGTGIIIMVSGSLEFWQALKSAQTNYGYSNLTKDIKSSNESYLSKGDDDSDSKKSQHLW
ncbi:preprotein translocase subunit SecY [Malacoplasma iowae]|uniref:Protein translocase subunit SecY n=2 Tax=Malacoplasma iowae TaxID=2116 RepID=A0A084U335_MALIO|nr:preprotein translocase subunit SecY [Malacoplasma iowae]VEU62068.1 preprotein translocase subunit SecY [Mycoplasmopsis fermentans]KFB07371.1 preprotein translocase subunit SecY [Malacoplasma iowae DK-CPA]QHG89984.1 preprotein translocase subunit SecY [Malacoplasma iowae 695]WPL36291.1 preprotein translocase subunit SecY [Malacoplasma iowae]WPL37294.1 preprotein translocase subunit SecY [Malacoplasma iowae]